jgi:hypothetical protein
MRANRPTLLQILTLVGISACADTGRVNVQLSPMHAVSQALTGPGERRDAETGFTPHAITATQFEMKILSAYISEDVDPTTMNNVGRSERIWVNPKCPDANGCRDSDVDYFDLSDPSQANLALNSQGLEIAAGSYRYVRVEFCIGGARGNIIRYKTASMPAALEATYGGCGVTSERLDPAVEVTDGSSIMIALEYDLSKEPLYWADGSTTCGSLDTATPCIGGITLTPQVVR